MIARSGQMERILLVRWRRGGEVAIGPVLEAGQLTGTGQVHFADGCGGVTMLAEVGSESRDIGGQDGTLRRRTTRKKTDTTGNANRILTVGGLEVRALLDQVVERGRSARLATLGL
ncbi:MAG: hypothetical protein VCF24_26155 [Candidatus Latescibacterota bacterium]